MIILVKIDCSCGQPYEFEVEPIDGRMYTTVGCPACGVDGTSAADAYIAQCLAQPAEAPAPQPAAQVAQAPAQPVETQTPEFTAPLPKAPSRMAMTVVIRPPSKLVPPPPAPVRPVTQSLPSAAASAAPGMAYAPASAAAQSVVPETPEAPRDIRLPLGILGALLGALIGSGILYAVHHWGEFRFPWLALLGIGIGVLTGGGAKLLFKGGSKALGITSGAIALAAVVGTLFLTYGAFSLPGIITAVVSVTMACLFAWE